MAEHTLDITDDVCPLTFVKTKLLLERMAPGDIACVRLKGAEPLENVPRSVAEHGHEVLSLAPVAGQGTGEEAGDGPGAGAGPVKEGDPTRIHELVIRKR